MEWINPKNIEKKDKKITMPDVPEGATYEWPISGPNDTFLLQYKEGKWWFVEGSKEEAPEEEAQKRITKAYWENLPKKNG